MTKREPICPYYGKCGGCSLQDLDRATQLQQKQERLSTAIGYENIRIFSGQEYFYRNRMDFVFFADGLGLREPGSWFNMVDIAECKIADNNLNRLLTEVRNFFDDVFYFDVKRRFGTYCYTVIRTPGNDSSVSIVLNKKSKKTAEAEARIKSFSEKTSAKNVIVTYIPHNRNVSVSEEYKVIKGIDRLAAQYLEQTFYFPVQGFFQVNQEIAEKVHVYCRELFSEYPIQSASLIDLYGGVGTFGILNAADFKQVNIIENYTPAVELAQLNCQTNNINNVVTTSLDAKHLHELKLSQPYFIILDPPRSGMHPKTLTQLNKLQPEALLYVSCNPKHLGNDLGELTSYRIKSAALFDMFPQTPHMESVIELTKK